MYIHPSNLSYQNISSTNNSIVIQRHHTVPNYLNLNNPFIFFPNLPSQSRDGASANSLITLS